MISACAEGSESVILRFHPRPMISSPWTTTAPTGTSPISSARWAQRRASSIQSSSVTGADGSEFVVARIFPPMRFAVQDYAALIRHGKQATPIRRGAGLHHAEDAAHDLRHDLMHNCHNHNAADGIRDRQGRH